MSTTRAARPPILAHLDHDAPSIFRPEGLLREARRQRDLPEGRVPDVCVLDPDGDVVRFLRTTGQAERSRTWACYHSELYEFDLNGRRFGIVGCAVGAPYAVLVAEQLFASGCRFLLSVTSAGQITPRGATPYFILIDRALRDEGTSYHYLPPSEYAEADAGLVAAVSRALSGLAVPVHQGTTWTTDAPFRETEAVIADRRARGILAVEMEAAALYAFARARGHSVLCLAHVTNQMARVEGDFEKGEADGATGALRVLAAAAAAWEVSGR